MGRGWEGRGMGGGGAVVVGPGPLSLCLQWGLEESQPTLSKEGEAAVKIQ